MASSVFFKFKSSKEPQRITFDGTGITVFELKREIIAVSGLGDGTDFDLFIYPEDSPTIEYEDDTTIIPRLSSVVARRLPASRPGAGRAARYVSGRAPVRAKARRPSPPRAVVSITPASAPRTEKEREEAFLEESGQAWEQQKEAMSHAKPVFRNNRPTKPIPDRDLPAGYVCYRCNQKGHWIQACPTNNDPNFKAAPPIKRTTGIPRSFLRTIEKPTGDDAEKQRGVMMNADGEYVVAEPDRKAWEKFQEKAKASAAQAETAHAGQKEIQERGMECPLDKQLFVDPVKTPCCGKTYCYLCIDNALAEGDLVCPNPECGKDSVLIDELAPATDMVEKIRAFETEKAQEKAAKEQQAKEEAAKSPKSPKSNNEHVSSVTVGEAGKAKDSEINGQVSPPHAKARALPGVGSSSSPPPASSAMPVKPPAGDSGGLGANAGNSDSESPSTASKKRRADTELPNDRKPPSAPRAMRQQQEQHAAQKSAASNMVQDWIIQMNALPNLAAGHPAAMPNMGGWNSGGSGAGGAGGGGGGGGGTGFPGNAYGNNGGMSFGMNGMMNGMNGMGSGHGGNMNGGGFDLMQAMANPHAMYEMGFGGQMNGMAGNGMNGMGANMNMNDMYRAWQQQQQQQQQHQQQHFQQDHQPHPGGMAGNNIMGHPQQVHAGANHNAGGANGPHQPMAMNGAAGVGGAGDYGVPPTGPAAGTFPNQQRTTFAEPLGGDNDAYFRKPVNPARHMKGKRTRAPDYRTL